MGSGPGDMWLVSIHGFDPRGPKVGGIETHVRQLLRHHPADMRMLLIGIDDFGDLELGKVHKLTIAGREIHFMPVIHIPVAEQTTAAASVLKSVTLRFAGAVLRYMPRVRKLVRGKRAVVEIERFEYALLARMLARRFVLVAHNEGDPRTDKMDSILSRYWYVNLLTERIAVALATRVYGVTPRIKERLATRYPAHADKTGVLTVSVDTELFPATPFDLSSGKLKLVYAGRLDEFKDPPLMFRVVRQLHEQLGTAFEFHYCGSADPRRFPEFAAIEPCTVSHGALTPAQVAGVMRDCHIGILVSYWEGMPCFLLELLSSGRAFAGLRLQQFDQVVTPGVNGTMVERADTIEENERNVARAVLAQWDDVRAGRVDPQAVHSKIIPLSVSHQLERLFTVFRELAQQQGPDATGVPAAAPDR